MGWKSVQHDGLISGERGGMTVEYGECLDWWCASSAGVSDEENPPSYVSWVAH